MFIRHQNWIETDTHIVLTLHEPWWAAWQKFGWDHRVEGIGISREAISKAKELGKKIRVNVLKYGAYEITPTMAMRYEANEFIPRDRKPLIVIPRDIFDRIPTEETVKKMEVKEDLRIKLNQQVSLGI